MEELSVIESLLKKPILLNSKLSFWHTISPPSSSLYREKRGHHEALVFMSYSKCCGFL